MHESSVGGILKVYILIFNFAFHQIYQRIMYEQVITQLFNFEKVNKYKRNIIETNPDGETENKQVNKLFQPSNTERQQSELGNNPSELTTKPLKKSYTIFQRDNFLAKVENKESELGSPTSTNNRQLGAYKSPSIITNNNQPPQQLQQLQQQQRAQQEQNIMMLEMIRALVRPNVQHINP